MGLLDGASGYADRLIGDPTNRMLLGMGIGLLQKNREGLGAGFGAGLQNTLGLNQIAAQQDEATARARQRKQMEEFIKTLPPDQQQRFMAFPKEAAGALFDKDKMAAEWDARLQNEPSLAAAKAKATTPYDVQKAKAVSDATLENKMRVAQAGKAVSNINMPPGEKEFDKAMGKGIGEQFLKDQQMAASAGMRMQTLNQAASLLGQVGSTGAGGATMLKVQKVARTLGVDVGNIGEKEAFDAISNKLALDARSSADGGGMPGAMSDADREFLRATVPNLSTTPEGNRIKIEAAMRLERRKIEYAALQREYLKQNGGRLDAGWYEFAASHFASKPMFEDLAAPKEGPGAVLRFDTRGNRVQ